MHFHDDCNSNNINSMCFIFFIESLFNGNEITVTLAIRQLYFDILKDRTGNRVGFKC